MAGDMTFERGRGKSAHDKEGQGRLTFVPGERGGAARMQSSLWKRVSTKKKKDGGFGLQKTGSRKGSILWWTKEGSIVPLPILALSIKGGEKG